MSGALTASEETRLVEFTLAQAGDSLGLARRIERELAEIAATDSLWRASSRN